MQPLLLTLKGFRGIRDGLGLDTLTLDFERLAEDGQLIAITGANGRGKSTVLDNMHPYLAMPSRAATAGPGGFSYYDHVFLPESEKDLTWAHGGRSYRSQVVIRLNGRRRTEAFLFQMDEGGHWRPVRLDDGTVSDGKVETYTRCVEALCGSADTFFTSVFSAQGKRQLSTYRNAEIKALLADLLGQDEIQGLGQKASETARLLKAGLAGMRQEQLHLQRQAQDLAQQVDRLGNPDGRVKRCLTLRQRAQATLLQARERHARFAALHEQAQAHEARRRQLRQDAEEAEATSSQTAQALIAQERVEQQRIERLYKQVNERHLTQRTRWQSLDTQRNEALAVLAQDAKVRQAIRRLPQAERVRDLRIDQSERGQQQVRRLQQLRASLDAEQQRLVNIEQQAGQAALRAEELTRRLGLTAQVPCVGTDLQGRCQLLGDAREAGALVPNANVHVTRLVCHAATAREAVARLKEEIESLTPADHTLVRAQQRAARAGARATALALRAARQGEIQQARDTLGRVTDELAQLPAGDPALRPVSLTPDELAERQQIEAARQAIQAQQARQAEQLRVALARIAAALSALPAPPDEAQWGAVNAALLQANQTDGEAEAAHLAAVRDADALAAMHAHVRALAHRQGEVAARIAAVEAELGVWSLFARCMSHDGLIALAIDDAGPALSSLANDLLLASHGPRFTLSIQTLVETGKGEREGFEILVHDGLAGDCKRLAVMSGGERTWINECLLRAVALYLAQHTGRRHEVLFSDEADGPLDPERKRMFMAMKRQVLRLGGYQREYFVSQTPELTAMADAVIDLERLASATELAA